LEQALEVSTYLDAKASRAWLLIGQVDVFDR